MVSTCSRCTLHFVLHCENLLPTSEMTVASRFLRWAFEQRNEDITKMLMKAGVPHTDRDAKGLTPVDLLEGGN